MVLKSSTLSCGSFVMWVVICLPTASLQYSLIVLMEEACHITHKKSWVIPKSLLAFKMNGFCT